MLRGPDAPCSFASGACAIGVRTFIARPPQHVRPDAAARHQSPGGKDLGVEPQDETLATKAPAMTGRPVMRPFTIYLARQGAETLKGPRLAGEDGSELAASVARNGAVHQQYDRKTGTEIGRSDDDAGEEPTTRRRGARCHSDSVRSRAVSQRRVGIMAMKKHADRHVDDARGKESSVALRARAAGKAGRR